MKFAPGWLTIGFTLCAGISAHAQTCAPPRLENSVAMEPIGDQGKVAVPITLNGTEKKFLFDTGGGLLNYIRSDVAVKLGMFRSDNFLAMDLAGNKSYKVAGARHTQFGAVTTQEVTIFQQVPDLAYDGILSAGTMTEDDLDMDFGAMRLNFFSADHCAGDVVYWPHQALAVVPVSLANGHFQIAVTLDGHALTAVADTGSPWTIIDSEWAKANLSFTLAAAPETPGTPPSDIPRDQPADGIYFRKYSALSFPGITVAHPLVVVRSVQFGDASDPVGRAPDMIIGMEVLRHLHLYYAANEKQLYITPAAPGPSPLPRDVTPTSSGHAWPQGATAYEHVWDPIHRPH